MIHALDSRILQEEAGCDALSHSVEAIVNVAFDLASARQELEESIR